MKVPVYLSAFQEPDADSLTQRIICLRDIDRICEVLEETEWTAPFYDVGARSCVILKNGEEIWCKEPFGDWVRAFELNRSEPEEVRGR